VTAADAAEVKAPPLSPADQRAAAVAQRDAVNQALYANGPYTVTDEYGKINPLTRALRNLREGEAGTTASDLGAAGGGASGPGGFTERTGRYEVKGLPGEPTKIFNSAENAQAYVDQQNAAWLQAHPAPPPSAAPPSVAPVATEAAANAASEAAAPTPETPAAPTPTAPEPATYGTVKNADGSYAVTRNGRPVTMGMDAQDALDQSQMYREWEAAHPENPIPPDIRKAVATTEAAPEAAAPAEAPITAAPEPTAPTEPSPEPTTDQARVRPITLVGPGPNQDVRLMTDDGSFTAQMKMDDGSWKTIDLPEGVDVTDKQATANAAYARAEELRANPTAPAEPAPAAPEAPVETAPTEAAKPAEP
jgi:hypothetical protein